ncbi:MAG: ribbon-helix-helix protein, CopG family [Candidatus Peribacteraceae bacterium]|nr:ribbon-helix-helix protein, CopG family [Candidatus Peribacteraceae bacterium]MBP9850391.1 ribbon-helix-helix protein, CopG family [Candidatus Peribacteraceae bacterium]
MTTISVPLSAELLKILDELVRDGVAVNKADAMRKALKKFSEDQAVERVLRAEKEPRLEGDLDTLAAQLR